MTRATPSRLLALLLLPVLAGCADAAYGMLAGTGASIAVIHRSPVDAVYSAITGRDCSIVWLDRGETYCRPKLPPPLPQAYFTRSLGAVDCWQAGTQGLGKPAPAGIAEGPDTLTPAQEINRTARWPQVWLGTE